MLCPKCGKESANLRICGYCQTPYPVDRPGQAGLSQSKRAAQAAKAANAAASSGLVGGIRSFLGRQSRATLWGVMAVIAVLTVVYMRSGGDKEIPVGVVVPNLIATPMSPVEANNTLNSINGAAPADVRGGVLVVRVPTAMWPDRRLGQLALAQQYARADEIVQGRKRAISFLDPDGNQFAKSEPDKGVSMTR